MKIDNTPARGNRDLLPANTAVRDHLLQTIIDVYATFGYERIETPALESLQRLQGGQGGENEKLIYRILKRGLPDPIGSETPVSELTDLGLRFDLTVPLARFYAQNHAQLPMPFRSFQFGPVWRAERPQKGRYRQFYQCDIDMLGEESVLAETELIEATMKALAAIGLRDTTLRLSDRRFLSALAEHAGITTEKVGQYFITLDKLDKIGWEGVQREMAECGITPTAVETTEDIITALSGIDATGITDTLGDTLPKLSDDVLEELSETITCINSLEDMSWSFDPTLVRGMGYYTGQIFEISHPDSASSLAGGGRYDRLIGRNLNTEIPACGFSLGFERIVDLFSTRPERQRLAVLYDNDVPLSRVHEIARQIRTEGRNVSPIMRSGKLGAQLGRLETWGYTSWIYVRGDAERTDISDERMLGENT